MEKFASEVADVLRLKKQRNRLSITAIPSSKKLSDSNYDKRFEDMFGILTELLPKLTVEWPILAKESISSAHKDGSRNPDEIMQNYKWNGFMYGNPKEILVFDDVITTGSHFRAVSKFLRSNRYKGKIIGIFWARSVWPCLFS